MYLYFFFSTQYSVFELYPCCYVCLSFHFSPFCCWVLLLYCIHMTQIIFSGNGHLGCFLIWTLKTDATVSIYVRIPWCTGHITGSGIPGLRSTMFSPQQTPPNCFPTQLHEYTPTRVSASARCSRESLACHSCFCLEVGVKGCLTVAVTCISLVP